MALELTRLSQKGQVVIPTQVRRKMGLKEGTKFLVVGLEDIIVLRKLQFSEEKLKLKKLLAEARIFCQDARPLREGNREAHPRC